MNRSFAFRDHSDRDKGYFCFLKNSTSFLDSTTGGVVPSLLTHSNLELNQMSKVEDFLEKLVCPSGRHFLDMLLRHMARRKSSRQEIFDVAQKKSIRAKI